jgi:hypothetical protein
MGALGERALALKGIGERYRLAGYRYGLAHGGGTVGSKRAMTEAVTM